MSSSLTNLFWNSTDSATPSKIGRIISLTGSGEAYVDFDGNPGGPVKALSTVQFDSNATDREILDSPVMLIFAEADLNQPVIVGLLHDRVIKDDSDCKVETETTKPAEFVEIDGRRVKLEARDELTLRCGAGSITLRKDGKILVKGKELLSRASGSQRIQGGSVAIN